MSWTLADIRRKTRLVTGRLTDNQITTSRLDDYINDFYIYTLPAELKIERQHEYYEFNTTPNVREYPFPSTTYTNIEPFVYVNEQPVDYYQEPNAFMQNNPYQVTQQNPWTGDGSTASYSTTLQGFPIIAGSVIVTDNTEVFTDDGAGVLTGDLGGSGTVNYTTGAVAVTFNSNVANGQLIYVSYIQYQAGFPQAVLVYDSKFLFFPPPDTVYRVKMKAWAIETALTSANDIPRLEEWGPAIAYGAARQIVADYGENERYGQIDALYQEQLAYIMRRTHQSLLNTRARPMF
jgi:hypothetical protein